MLRKSLVYFLQDGRHIFTLGRHFSVRAVLRAQAIHGTECFDKRSFSIELWGREGHFTRLGTLYTPDDNDSLLLTGKPRGQDALRHGFFPSLALA